MNPLGGVQKIKPKVLISTLGLFYEIGIYLCILHFEINDANVCVGKYQFTDRIITPHPLCIQRCIHIHIPQM